jgi:hypothetical protein
MPELLKQAAQRMRRRYQAVLGEQGLPKEAHDLANQILALVERRTSAWRTPPRTPTSSFLTVVDHAIDARLQRARLLITQEEWNEAELLLSRALEIRADHPGHPRAASDGRGSTSRRCRACSGSPRRASSSSAQSS